MASLNLVYVIVYCRIANWGGIRMINSFFNAHLSPPTVTDGADFVYIAYPCGDFVGWARWNVKKGRYDKLLKGYKKTDPFPDSPPPDTECIYL